MDKKIVNLLQKMNEGNPLSKSELLRLIVHDLVEPKVPGKNALIPSESPNLQIDFTISIKGNEMLQNQLLRG